MLRLSIKFFGYLMLIAAMLSVAAAFRGFGGVMSPGLIAVSQVSGQIRNAALMVTTWLLCLVAVPIVDYFSYRIKPEHDPYEAHPKMSPSVQPAYVPYADI